jgi:hypothetical protein
MCSDPIPLVRARTSTRTRTAVCAFQLIGLPRLTQLPHYVEVQSQRLHSTSTFLKRFSLGVYYSTVPSNPNND